MNRKHKNKQTKQKKYYLELTKDKNKSYIKNKRKNKTITRDNWHTIYDKNK